MSARKLMIEAWALRQGVSHGIAAVEVDAMLGILRIAGFAVVPVEPTEGMVRSGLRERDHGHSATAIWKMMITAAQEDSRE